jgi:hypothetical protein
MLGNIAELMLGNIAGERVWGKLCDTSLLDVRK